MVSSAITAQRTLEALFRTGMIHDVVTPPAMPTVSPNPKEIPFATYKSSWHLGGRPGNFQDQGHHSTNVLANGYPVHEVQPAMDLRLQIVRSSHPALPSC